MTLCSAAICHQATKGHGFSHSAADFLANLQKKSMFHLILGQVMSSVSENGAVLPSSSQVISRENDHESMGLGPTFQKAPSDPDIFSS